MLKKIAIIIVISTVAILIGFLALPRLVDRVLLPPMLAKTPFSFSRATTNKITPYLLEGSVELKDGDKPILSVPRFQVQFTPQSLWNKKIRIMTLEHATIHLYRENDQWVLPGFLHNPSAGDSGSRTEGNLYLLPLGVQSLVLDQCRLILHDSSRPDLHVGVSGRLEPHFSSPPETRRLESLSGSFIFSDDLSAAASLSATVSSEGLSVRVGVDQASLFLPPGYRAALLQDLDFNHLSAQAELHLDAHSLALKRYQLAGTVAGLHYAADRINVSGGREGNSLSFEFTGNSTTHRYKLSSLALLSPVHALLEIEGHAAARIGNIDSSGTVQSTLLSGVEDKSGMPVSLSYHGSWSETAGYRVALDGECLEEVALVLKNGSLQASLGRFSFSSLVKSHQNQLQATLDLKSGPIEVRANQNLQFTTSDLAVRAILNRSDEHSSARMNVQTNELFLAEKSLVLDDLNLDLPLPLDDSGSVDEPGRLSVAVVELHGEDLFSVSADFFLRDSDYHGSGILTSLYNADLMIPFQAQVAPQSRRLEGSWNFPATFLEATSLPPIVSLPPNLDFSASLEARGEISFDGTLSARLQTTIADGRLELSDKNIVVEGINCTVVFPELPRLHSAPSQICTAATIDLSALHFSDLEVAFRLEDLNSLFIEKSKLNWCGGTLESGALRLSNKTPEFDSTFFCSRIGLAELLDQFGFQGTEGEGSLNGKLPIRISRDRIDFEDGFLFSTPGTGGIVRFTDTELLRRGVGAVSETGYLNYTLRALEDFSYNWTKLSFDSVGDDLLLTLELDGKPSTPLPFKFNKNGMIVESAQGKGLQYPIRLDVNFRIPLVELFRIGRSINSIMGSGE